MFTVVNGLLFWAHTLRDISEMSSLFHRQPPDSLVRLQDLFQCCGWTNLTDTTIYSGYCANAPTIPSQLVPCRAPLIYESDQFWVFLYTCLFAFSALQFVVIVLGAMLIRHREVLRRYQLIDRKYGF